MYETILSFFGFVIFATLLYSTPLIFAALGSCISESSGIINIGIEGMMTIGAFVGCSVAYFTGNPWIAFFSSGVAGMLLSFFHAIASIKFNADQTISGTAINMIGAGAAIMCSYAIFGATDSIPISLDEKIPILFQDLFVEDNLISAFCKDVFKTYATNYIALILAIVISFVFYKTKFGLHLRACGEHPKACETLGINVIRVRFICVLLSGFLAGLGGGCLTLAVTNQFRPTSVVGQGFIAIAAVIFGKYNPIGVLLGCLLFGFFNGMKVIFVNYNISPDFLSMIPYLITILILMLFVKNQSVPNASGKPYVRGE